jgi:GntR family transcriptional regulator
MCSRSVTGMGIDHESATPVYAQLAGILRDMIRSGEIPSDRPLPSVKRLMQTYGVAQGTAEHAVRLLKEEGLVKTVIGKGVYVK